MICSNTVGARGRFGKNAERSAAREQRNGDAAELTIATRELGVCVQVAVVSTVSSDITRVTRISRTRVWTKDELARRDARDTRWVQCWRRYILLAGRTKSSVSSAVRGIVIAPMTADATVSGCSSCSGR